MQEAWVLGIDVGGTSSRMLVATPDGRVVAAARGGPGNPMAIGTAAAAAELRGVFRACVSAELDRKGIDVDQIRTATVGLAGLSGVRDLPGFVADALPGLDPDRVVVVPDFVAAFASGCADPSGYVVLSGTGAGAMRIDHGVVTRRHDAWGWLLGDDGSGFWLGREAVRATLTTLEAGRTPGPLARQVLTRTGATDFASLVAAVYADPPTRLAELAPAVTQAATSDPVAAGIVGRAAGLLHGALLALDPEPGSTVVTTGAVLGPDSPVRDALLRVVRDQGDHRVRSASDGLTGALWLALGRLEPADRPEMSSQFHERLVAAVRDATPV